jgi:rod shape-determining protein MreC
MFSKKTVLILAGILLVTLNILLLAITIRRPAFHGLTRAMAGFAAPFQELASRGLTTAEAIWRDYFALVTTARDNQALRRQLDQALQQATQYRELELENARLRELLSFKRSLPGTALAAEIIGKDPSAWFKTVIVDKGSAVGVQRGLPAVTTRGVVGQIVEVSPHQSKLMLLIDRNSAADALIQRTRARGIVKGASSEECYLDYVLYEDEVRVGDEVVASGFDGVYPKGLLIGTVTAVNFQGSDFFKEVKITPAVDFDKLEDVLIILKDAPTPPAAPPPPAPRYPSSR